VAKRHPSLVSLSQDHHHGLALALRLRQGDKALLNDGWTHDRAEQAVRTRKFYMEGLRPHFKAEEEVLFPLMRSMLEQCSVLIDKLVTQHRELEQLISSLSAPGKSLDGILVALGTLLDEHIRLEERQLFPQYEKGIPEELKMKVQRKIEEVVASGGD